MDETLKIGVTAVCTFLTTLITVSKCFVGYISKLNGNFNGTLEKLNCRIDDLSNSISSLDKNLAVQTAVLENCMKRNQGKC